MYEARERQHHQDTDASRYAWTRHPLSSITQVIAILVLFVQSTWFVATLSKRMEIVEVELKSLEMRYQQEVIPRQDLRDRLERLEKAVDRVTEMIIEHDAHSAPK